MVVNDEIVLIVTPTGRDAAVAVDVLAKAGVQSTICADLADAAARITGTAGAVVFAEEALRGPGVDLFLDALRQQEQWSDLPLVLLTGSGKATLESERARKMFASVATLTLLERPLRSATLVATVQAALRARQRQIEMRNLLGERDAAVESLREAKRELENANAAKDHFLATLSHELRTPLTPILMSLSEDEVAPELPEDVRERMQMIRHNIELEARLIDDLLDITRITKGKLELRCEVHDVHSLLRAAVDVCGSSDLNRARLALCIDLGADHHHVWGDAARLQQLFWNLLKNAIKFTPHGGRIEVRTLNPRPGALAIQISDTGIGIMSDKLPRIFEAFEQGGRNITRRFGGLGLGLAIGKAIVDLHRGTIRATSEGENRGTTFTVELNTVVPESKLQGSTDGDTLGSDIHASILLVEDHSSTAEVLKRLLLRAGHQVQTAGSVAEAQDRLAGGDFHLLISDLGLPDGSGLELVQRAKLKGLSAIALSGYGMDEDVRSCLEGGFDDHVTKPVDWRRLKAIIQRLLVDRESPPHQMAPGVP